MTTYITPGKGPPAHDMTAQAIRAEYGLQWQSKRLDGTLSAQIARAVGERSPKVLRLQRVQ